jgi:hypothetical protein
MSRIAKLVGTSAVILAIAIASLAQASPIGTPAANRVPTGKGKNLGGLFDNMVGRHDDDQASGGDGKRRPHHKHLNNKEWHEAYIAKHGHDLPSPLERPGGH